MTEMLDNVARLGRPRIAFNFSDALDASGVDWYVICREEHHHAWFRKTGRAKSILATTRATLPHAVAPGVTAVIYANNTQKNREMIEAREDLLHVQMPHGDSDKPPSYSPLTRNFDQVFVSGQMGQDRYARNGVYIPAGKFIHVGRPQLALMSCGKRDEVRTAVYMPTWLGHYEDTKFSSLERAAKVITRFGRAAPGVKLIFKPHPLSFKHPDWPGLEKGIRSALKKIGGEFAAPELSAFEAYEIADLLLTDISSTVIDFLFTARPQILFLPENFDLDESRYPSISATYQVGPDLSGLEAKIIEAIGPDSLTHAREEMREYALGSHAREDDSRFGDAIRALASASSMVALPETKFEEKTSKEKTRCPTPRRKSKPPRRKSKNQPLRARSARLSRLRKSKGAPA